jgi:hypothetical protein
MVTFFKLAGLAAFAGFAFSIGVLLVRLVWVLLFRWAIGQARSGPNSR